MPARFRTALVFVPLLLAACQPVQAAAAPTLAPSLTPSAPPTATAVPPTVTPAVTATPAPQPTPALQRCSPLQDIPLERMPAIVANPFHPPKEGSDDPHMGVDLAYFLDKRRIALPGLPVQAVFSGQVAAVIRDRFPYGNAILIETPLDALPAAWLARLPVPTPLAAPIQPISLTCPSPTTPYAWNPAARSLYLLYAHLQQAPAVQPGTPVACGQTLNLIGQSGNALNPHLHLEARIGPAGARLGSLAHYDPTATQDEMAAYCTWRVQGVFQLIDPLNLLSAPAP